MKAEFSRIVAAPPPPPPPDTQRVVTGYEEFASVRIPRQTNGETGRG